jgi:hypothetical protein
MISLQRNLKKVFNKKVLLIKSLINGLDFDLNKLTEILNTEEYLHVIKCNQEDFNSNKALDYVFQIRWIHRCIYLRSLYDFIKQETKTMFRDGAFDLFVSFKGARGQTHKDSEHVLIVGLYNTTEYYFPALKKTYYLEKGDVLYIPRGLVHTANSNEARAVASISLYPHA